MTEKARKYNSPGKIVKMPTTPKTATPQPPYSENAEKATLGAVIVNPKNYAVVASIIQDKPDKQAFYYMRHNKIWEALTLDLAEFRKTDYVTLCTRLKDMVDSTGKQSWLELIGGPAYITSLINEAPSHTSAEIYARLVNRAYIRRALIAYGDDLKNGAYNHDTTIEDLLEFSARRLHWIASMISDSDRNFSTAEFMDAVTDSILKPDENRKPYLTTGFRDLDDLTGGFFPKEVTYIGAPPKFGKTTTVLSMMINQVLDGNKILYIPLEMTREQIGNQLIATLTGIDIIALKRRTFRPDQEDVIIETAKKLKEWGLVIDDSSLHLTPNKLKQIIETNTAKYGAFDGVCVDGLWLMYADTTRPMKRHEEIGLIVKGLAEIAHKYNIPLQVVHQFNREAEGRAEKRGGLEKSRPRITDFSESSAVEKHANLLLGLWRESRFSKDEDASNDVEIHVLANRQGESGKKCVLEYDAKTNRLNDYSHSTLGGSYDY